jgi:hypothetical protein
MKVGDLLISKTATQENGGGPILLILDIKKHSSNSDRDRIRLQWMPRNGGEALRGEFSRLMVDKRYRVT